MKILIIHTGGTISCAYENGVLSPKANITPIISKIFRNYRDVKLVYKRLCSVLSENTDGKILNKIVLGVRKYVLSGKYDGVIVTLGSDTLAYTSAAISYAVGLSRTPCITVSSNLPLSVPHADGNANLKAAVAVIRSKKASGALTAYTEGNGRVAIYRATRIAQQPPYSSAPVPVGEIYGTVKDGEFFKNERYVEEDDDFAFDKPFFSAVSPVFLLNVYPGMLYPSLPRKTKAVILGAYHSGTVNTQSSETVKFASRCKKRGIKVYVSGLSGGADYESMTLYEKLSLIRLPRLSSPEAMYVKLWLLNSKSRKFTDEMLLSPLGGDVIKSPAKAVLSSDEDNAKQSDADKDNRAAARNSKQSDADSGRQRNDDGNKRGDADNGKQIATDIDKTKNTSENMSSTPSAAVLSGKNETENSPLNPEDTDFAGRDARFRDSASAAEAPVSDTEEG